MDDFNLNQRRVESKQGWRSPNFLPPLPLIAVFAIVVFLLSLSQYSSFKSWSSDVGTNIQLLVFLTPVILVLFVSSGWITEGWWFSFGSQKAKKPMNLSRIDAGYGN